MFSKSADASLPVRLAAIALIALGGTPAFGQDYPTRPVRWVIPFAPGGINDIIGRLVAQRLAERLGQQVVIDNRGGGGGIIAAEIVARAPADGHTILQTNAGPHAINPSLYPKLPYDAVRDFAPITQLVATPMILVVPAASPARTLKELIAYARSRPEGLNYGSTGNGSTPHLTTEHLKAMTGLRLEHVPYKGAAPAFVDMLAGQIAMQFTTFASAQAFVTNGRVRVLAVCGPNRLPLIPDVPTMAEAGLPKFEVSIWNGMLAPARTPAPIVSRLHREIAEILRVPEVRERIIGTGSEPVGSTPEAFGAYIRAEIAAWGTIVQRSGAKP
jgi:tripartite-type tricarboxylate transporter receptor subunit TctC